MKAGRTFAALALGVVLLGGTAVTQAAEAPVKIGVIGPLTGGAAVWGNAAAQAAKILAAEVNAQGGLEVAGKKHPVEVIAYDDEYKAANAIAAYNRLLNQDGVKYMITVGSAPTMAMAPSIEADKTILFSSAGVEKAVDPKSRNLFRMLSLLRDYVPAVVTWVRDNRSGRKVTIINPNDESGWNSGELAVSSYKKNGFEVLGSELYERTLKDFTPLLTKILANKPDIIELASSPPATSGLIVRQARDLGYKGLFVKDSGAATREVVEAAGKEGAEGLISLHFANPTSDGYKRLATEDRNVIGQDPDDLIVVYYDAVNVILKGIQKAGDINDTAKVSDALFKILPIKSVQGDELTWGGSPTPGDPNQIMTFSYISVMKNGEPNFVGKVK